MQGAGQHPPPRVQQAGARHRGAGAREAVRRTAWPPRPAGAGRGDLRVERGAAFGFIGPNGAGKTTFVKALLGIVRPTGGEVRLLGGDPQDPRVRAAGALLLELAREGKDLEAVLVEAMGEDGSGSARAPSAGGARLLGAKEHAP